MRAHRAPVHLIATAAILLAGAVPAAAAVDPERNATNPTSWHWVTDVSEGKLRKLAADNGERVISINHEPPIGRLTAALVRNKGPYARAGDFFVGKSPKQVIALTKKKGRRLIDLEPYQVMPGSKTRFDGVTVRNSGASGKGWWWNYDLTPAQVTADIKQHKIRLVDLASYERNGKRRYAYVGIKNTGADKRGWWWYYNVSPAFVQARADVHHARLIDIERVGPGKLTVVMVRSEGQFSLGAAGYTAGKLNKVVQSQGVRITDIERYGDRYAAVTIDDVNAETGRLRAILRASPFKDGYFGVFAKAVNGPTYVGLAHRAAYQPYSVLKLVPHLFVMDRYDSVFDTSPNYLDTSVVSWQSPPGKPDESACPGTSPTQTYTASLRQTLTRGLGESLNRAHESLLLKYGPTAITDRVRDLGLKHTVVYYGCKHPGLKDWTSNRTTLADMGWLFEGVERKTFFKHHWQQVRDEFYGLMASWPKSKWIQPVVADEAAKQGKSGQVSSFMSYVELKGKGGGVNSCAADGTCTGGRSYSYRLLLPFKGAGGVTLRAFVGGDFVNDIEMPCNEDDANDPAKTVSAACKTWAQQMQATYAALVGEAQRQAIRSALATWPQDAPPPPPPTPAPRPDLVVQRAPGGSLVIRNIGTGAAGSFHLSSRTGTARPTIYPFGGLAAGAQTPAGVPCEARRVLVVDPNHEVPESNEANNSFSCS
ncbi:MAG TPA: serine hydrolase [Thermoleophilaceae bacterium]